MLFDELFLHWFPDIIHSHMHIAPALGGQRTHAVERPPCGIPAKTCQATVRLIRFRQICNIRINRHIDRRGDIVQGEPAQRTHLIGQPVAALNDGGINCEMYRNTAFAALVPAAVDAVQLQFIKLHEGIGHRGNDIFSIFIRDCQRLAHVIRSSFVIVMENAHHLLQGNQCIGFH